MIWLDYETNDNLSTRIMIYKGMFYKSKYSILAKK